MSFASASVPHCRVVYRAPRRSEGGLLFGYFFEGCVGHIVLNHQPLFHPDAKLNVYIARDDLTMFFVVAMDLDVFEYIFSMSMSAYPSGFSTHCSVRSCVGRT